MYEPIYLNEKIRTESKKISENIPSPHIGKLKSRWTILILCFFLGSFGVHKFYTGNKKAGWFYLAFCWTLIPTIISFFEFLCYLFCSEIDLNNKIANRKSMFSIV